MDRQLLAYVLIGAMVALAVSMVLFDMLSRRRRAEWDRQLDNAEYERVMARREKSATEGER